MSKNTKEPLLTENENRYVMFPIVDHDIWKMYKRFEIVVNSLFFGVSLSESGM